MNHFLTRCFAGLMLLCMPAAAHAQQSSWIRINQLGYTPFGVKAAVWGSKSNDGVDSFYLVNAETKLVVFRGFAGKSFGSYGPFRDTKRLDFTSFETPGTYFLQAGNTTSPPFRIGSDVYNGTADFCLRYLRQQRTGFNPFLNDSCHTHDGYSLYGETAGIKDSTYIDVTGGWHDASDYLQYATTSANTVYHLLMAFRDFPKVFADNKRANGLDGKNGTADVVDEACWGLNWLLKMHPKDEWMFNQIADDRDHISMRFPKQDSQYARGYQRPVYFINGEPQQRGKFLNNTTGTSSTAAKLSSAFALGAVIFKHTDKTYSHRLRQKSASAWRFALQNPGVTQTASVKAPYIYAEDNWVDDMELAALHQQRLTEATKFAMLEPVTPWLGKDTANHYQWYPFINVGHYELAKLLRGEQRSKIIGFYRNGIESVLKKSTSNAFYRGVPFIWCSNNLTVAFAIQCYWYRQLTGDNQYRELEQSTFDWLFGLNPWGTSMVYGLPAWGDTPTDPHSAFTHLGKYPIDGGLIDGPVYGSIYSSLIGIRLYEEDEYAAFQSKLAVYHDDYGDYSTNEPTLDGTASLVYLMAAMESEASSGAKR
jgi:endoglucanase